MTPYTIRQRRANIAAHGDAEAYPGQREKLLASLIAGDAELAAEERERAAEARHGARYITEALARYVLPEHHRAFPYGESQARKALAGEDGPEVLANLWRNALSPSGSKGNGADTTASLARKRASGRDDFGNVSVVRLTLAEAESMMDWPIYRVATARRCTTLDCTSTAHPGSIYCADCNGLTEPLED